MHVVCVHIVPAAANTIQLLKQNKQQTNQKNTVVVAELVIHILPRNQLHVRLKSQRLSWGCYSINIHYIYYSPAEPSFLVRCMSVIFKIYSIFGSAGSTKSFHRAATEHSLEVYGFLSCFMCSICPT